MALSSKVDALRWAKQAEQTILDAFDEDEKISSHPGLGIQIIGIMNA